MDIKNLTNNVGTSRTNDAVRPQSKGTVQGGPEASNAANTDRVTLTEVLSQVRIMETKSKDISIDNAERIASIKAAINDGSYQVDPQRIAEKLIQTEALFNKV